MQLVAVAAAALSQTELSGTDRTVSGNEYPSSWRYERFWERERELESLWQNLVRLSNKQEIHTTSQRDREVLETGKRTDIGGSWRRQYFRLGVSERAGME